MTTAFAEYRFDNRALRDLVRSAWSASYEAAAAGMPGVIAPDAHVEFVFQTGAPSGLSSHPEAATPRAMIFALRRGVLSLTPSGANRIVAFRVAPAVASVILKRSLVDCWNRAVPLADLIGSEADRLLEQVAHTPQAGIGALLESWLNARLTDWNADDRRNLRLQNALFWDVVHEPLSTLADDIGVTVRTLRRHCERYAGLSPKQVTMSGRILRACVTLRTHRDVSIAGVADGIGFNDQAAFTNAFRHYVGMTPAKFRAEPVVFCEGVSS